MNCEHRISKEQAGEQVNANIREAAEAEMARALGEIPQSAKSPRGAIVCGPMAEGRDICQIAIDEQQLTPFCPYPDETTETCPIVIRRK